MTPGIEFPLIVGTFTLLAAISDLRVRRIPNSITVPTALAGLVYHTCAPHGHGVLFALAGLGVGFALLLIPALLGGGGMGDVKLLAALGVWLGPLGILVAFAGSVVGAAAMAVVVMIGHTLQQGLIATRGKYLATSPVGSVVEDPENRLKQAKKRRVVPFAVPVALSTWTLLAWMLLRNG